MVNHMQANNRLRFRRRALDITQKDIAQKVGIDQTYYSLIERGNRVPKVDLAWKICRALNTTIDELFPMEVFFESEERAHAIDRS